MILREFIRTTNERNEAGNRRGFRLNKLVKGKNAPRKPGLAAYTEFYLGRTLNKDLSIVTSKWNSETLSPDQVGVVICFSIFWVITGCGD